MATQMKIYELGPGPQSIVMIPQAARILNANVRASRVRVSALIDPQQPEEPVAFWVIPEGDLADSGIALKGFNLDDLTPLDLVEMRGYAYQVCYKKP